MARFFDFSQNNSGGAFSGGRLPDDVLTRTVIVEAEDYRDANSRAERLGIYFNGCEAGYDCPCCGDRWYAMSGYDDGDKVPSYFGVPIESRIEKFGPWMKDFEVSVVYINGRVDRYKSVPNGENFCYKKIVDETDR